MPRKFKEARQINKLKVIEAAARLGVSQPTLSAWEGERKSPGLDNLENMSDHCHFLPSYSDFPNS